MEQRGYSVKLTGKNLSVRTDGNELYRLSQRGDRWLWYDTYGNAGGDNIALVRELQPNCGYAEAVFQLLGAPSVRRPPPPPPREPLKLPEAQARVDAGHQKRAARIAEITGQDTGHWSPDPAQGRDLAEQNAHQVQQACDRAERKAHQVRKIVREPPRGDLEHGGQTERASKVEKPQL